MDRLLALGREGVSMKWRVMVELGAADGTVQVHEVSSGECTVAACSAETLGLSIANGKTTLAGLQRQLVQAQAEEHCRSRRRCLHCGAQRPLKDFRPRQLIPARLDVDSYVICRIAADKIRSCSQTICAGRRAMVAAVVVTRSDHTASELRALASKCDDAAQVRRMLALALVLEGCSRTQAAEQTGMERQTLRDWVHRYNEDGIDGLRSRTSPGRTPFLSEEQKAELKALVLKGPDPDIDVVVRWRCVDLREQVKQRFLVLP